MRIKTRVLEKFRVRNLKRKILVGFLELRMRYNGKISKGDSDILRSWIQDFRNRNIPYFITSGPLKNSKAGENYTILWKAGRIRALPVHFKQKIMEDDSIDDWTEEHQKDLEAYSGARLCQCRNGCDHHGFSVCGLPVKPGNRFLCLLCAQKQDEIQDGIYYNPFDIYDDYDIAERILDK